VEQFLRFVGTAQREEGAAPILLVPASIYISWILRMRAECKAHAGGDESFYLTDK
jgi:hypothetical protein